MSITGNLLVYAREIGVDLLGVTGVEAFLATKSIVKERERLGLYSPFAPKDIELACRPQRILPGAKSIVALGINYYQGELAPLAADRGYLSRSAMGLDYHPVVKGKLTSLGDFLKREAPGKKSIGFVDTGPFFDKAVAQRAGLGYYAGNTLLATELGTWVFLGGILTEVELTPTTPSPKGPSPKTCPLDCSLCIRSCPTGALIAPGVLDYKRCLSYLTQKKGYVPREFRKAMGLRLYGCDTCQDSCLANEGAQKSQHSQFYPSTKRLPKLSQLLKMNRREFNLCFGDSSAGWRGRTILQRNALIALGNMGDRALVPEVKALLGDSRSLLRGHAAWALGQLGGREARAALEKALTWESVEEVKEEIINALRGE